MMSETKFDVSFPKGLFQLQGHLEVYRFDRNGKSDRMLLFIRKELVSKLIESQMSIKGFFIELNLSGSYVAFITLNIL